MMIEILSDTFVTSIDFFKVFFCLKYLFSFDIKIKAKQTIIPIISFFSL